MPGKHARGARLASALIWLFALQTVLRLLAMLTPLQRMPKQVLLIHALDMALLAGLALLLFRAVRGRRALQLVLALALSAVLLLLFAYDSASIIAMWFRQRVQPLATVAIFYCNAETVRACAQPFPGLAAGLGLFWVGLAALIFRASDALAARFDWLFGSRLKFILYALVFGWSAVWLVGAGQLVSFEPLVRFLGKTPLGAQPEALMRKPRPDYRVAATPGAKPRLLILIAIDSLRADAVELRPGQASRTPFLRELAASGDLHNLGPAVAICPTSYCGITGLLSSSDWATLKRGPPLMLPDVLAENGYRSHFLLSGPHLRVLNLAKLYGPNVSTLLDDSSPDSSALIDDREQVRRLQALPLADPARSFVFIHLMSAHAAGLRFDQSGESASRRNSPDSSARFSEPYSAYYDRGVQQADLILRQLFGVLAERGLLNRATIIITADHGERLTGEVGHGGTVSLDTAQIPLLVYDPGGKARWPMLDGILSQADIAPTLLAAAAIAAPPQWAGTALQQDLSRRAAPSDTTGQSALVGRIDANWVMLSCDVRSGVVTAIPQTQALPQAPAALFALWSQGTRDRADAAKCQQTSR